MSTSKPIEWVSALIERFEDQVQLNKKLFLFLNFYLISVAN